MTIPTLALSTSIITAFFISSCVQPNDPSGLFDNYDTQYNEIVVSKNNLNKSTLTVKEEVRWDESLNNSTRTTLPKGKYYLAEITDEYSFYRAPEKLNITFKGVKSELVEEAEYFGGIGISKSNTSVIYIYGHSQFPTIIRYCDDQLNGSYQINKK